MGVKRSSVGRERPRHASLAVMKKASSSASSTSPTVTKSRREGDFGWMCMVWPLDLTISVRYFTLGFVAGALRSLAQSVEVREDVERGPDPTIKGGVDDTQALCSAG